MHAAQSEFYWGGSAELVRRLRRVIGCGALSARLQVAHAPTDLVVLAVSGCRPDSPGYRIIVGYEGRHARCALTAQALLAGTHQRQSDALTPMTWENSQAVHVASPAIPCGDQRTNDLPLGLGNQQRPRGVGYKPPDVCNTVRRARVSTPRR